jgi:hypothetical protein
VIVDSEVEGPIHTLDDSPVPVVSHCTPLRKLATRETVVDPLPPVLLLVVVEVVEVVE